MNPFELMDALVDANIPARGCTANGKVFGMDGSEIQDRPDVAGIIDALNPVYLPTLEERMGSAEATILELMMM
jgi:hypothetical protein